MNCLATFILPSGCVHVLFILERHSYLRNLLYLIERKDDIPELVEHFIKITGPKLGKKINGIDRKAIQILLNYDWAGNVRELNNIIERAINLTEGNIITSVDLPLATKQDYMEIQPGLNGSFNPDMVETQKALVEAKYISMSLRKHNGNRTLAAKELGMSRSSIYRKIIKYGLKGSVNLSV